MGALIGSLVAIAEWIDIAVDLYIELSEFRNAGRVTDGSLAIRHFQSHITAIICSLRRL